MSGGGSRLSFFTVSFNGCKIIKNCYNSDMLHHYYYGAFMKKKIAFTLAEVLITLGIIGVVAAMTLPVLIQNNINRTVETRLAKFYSVFNQALKMAEVEYGDKEDWYQNKNGVINDENGNPIEGSSLILEWYNIYLAKHIKTIKITVDKESRPTFYLADGSAFAAAHSDGMRDWIFYSSDPEKCIARHGSLANAQGKCAFRFIYMPANSTSPEWKYHIKRGLEPYKYDWDGSNEDLYNNAYAGCNESSTCKNCMCTSVIQANGWKIPKNYPYRVSR